MAESVELPSRLGILPFRNKVLLPGAIIRIRCTSPSSVKLVEQELWQREEKGLIGILPVRDAAETTTAIGPVLSQDVGSDSSERSSRVHVGASDSHRLDVKNQQENMHWHTRGVAARALHLSRGVEKPSGRVTYIVVLEGLCRFSVQELSTRGTYYTARISPLEMTKAEMEQVGQDPDFMTLSRQFKAAATELISVLEQKQKTEGRTKVLLETVPVHKLADIFVASFEISFEEQLSMLDSVDLKVRLSKATELVDRHLQSIRVAEKITQKVEGQLSKSQKEFLLRQQDRRIVGTTLLVLAELKENGILPRSEGDVGTPEVKGLAITPESPMKTMIPLEQTNGVFGKPKGLELVSHVDECLESGVHLDIVSGDNVAPLVSLPLIADWILPKVNEIQQFVGISHGGCEDQFNELIITIEASHTLETKSFKKSRELQRLSWAINYDAKGGSSTRGKSKGRTL